MRREFDFLVLGGGSAGYAAARTAAAGGLRVGVVEGGAEVGGLCILRGCMPSKSMLESAVRFRTLKRAEEFGLRAGPISVRAEEIQARKRCLIGEFAAYRKEQLESGRFEFIRGKARFVDAHSVRVDLSGGGEEVLRARTFLIATGSRVRCPDVPGIDLPGLWDSDAFLAAEELPDSAVVLGAGPVGLEAAYYLAALGSKVTIVQRGEHLLHGADPDVADALRGALEHLGIRIFTGTKLRRIERDGALWVVRFEHGGREHSVAAVRAMNAMGRVPELESLDLSAAGVRWEPGCLPVGRGQRTSRSHIFAAGDTSGPFEIVHLAIEQGEMAARNAIRHLRGEDEPFEEMDYRLKVFACFTEPQVALAGAHEAELHDARRNFLTATYPFADHGKALVHGETEGFVKLLADAATGEILGGAVVGPQGSELIHEIVVAMRFRCTVHQFARIPHYHPTLAEIWTYPAEELAERCGKQSIAPL